MTHGGDELFHRLVFGGTHRLDTGRSYLVKERKPGKAWTYFTGALDDGFYGMYVTRQHPNHVDKRHGPRTLRVVWLSTTLGKDYVDPHNLGALTNLINAFSEGPRRSGCLLDRREIVMQGDCALIVSVDDRAFDPKEMAFLERNTVLLE